MKLFLQKYNCLMYIMFSYRFLFEVNKFENHNCACGKIGILTVDFIE